MSFTSGGGTNMVSGGGLVSMQDVINQVAISQFIDKSDAFQKGLIFTARDEVMARFNLDKHTATELIARHSHISEFSRLGVKP